MALFTGAVSLSSYYPPPPTTTSATRAALVDCADDRSLGLLIAGVCTLAPLSIASLQSNAPCLQARVLALLGLQPLPSAVVDKLSPVETARWEDSTDPLHNVGAPATL